MASCTPLVIQPDNAGLALSSSGDATCCAEVTFRVGVKYNAQWKYNNSVNYNATVG